MFRAQINAFFAALQFLIITPAFIKRPFTQTELGRAVGYFPLVGLLLGAALAGANFLFGRLFPSVVNAALLLALWVLLTGALHLDGFLDSLDGLLGGTTPEQRLVIMRDERVGAFSMAGGVLLLLLKFSILSALPDRSAALLVAPILGRSGISLAIIAFPYGRLQGLGRDMKAGAHWQQALLASVIAVLTTIWMAGWLGVAALAITTLVLLCASWFTMRLLPGLTGDIYGALVELIEVFVLLTFIG